MAEMLCAQDVTTNEPKDRATRMGRATVAGSLHYSRSARADRPTPLTADHARWISCSRCVRDSNVMAAYCPTSGTSVTTCRKNVASESVSVHRQTAKVAARDPKQAPLGKS